MGTVRQLRPTPEAVTIGAALQAWTTDLETTPIDKARTKLASRHTIRAYTTTIGLVLPADMAVAELATNAGETRLRTAFTERWGTASPATRNAKRAALMKFVDFLHRAGLLPDDADPTRGIEYAGKTRPKPRTRPPEAIRALIDDQRHDLRERAFWALLYESWARADEVLSLDVDDLDLRNRTARVVGKGGEVEVIAWETTAAKLLARYLRGRTTGPVFTTARRGKGEATGQVEREHLDADRRKRLSYGRALELFKDASGGWSLHDLRHSGITHALEDGVPMPVVMAKSRHRDLASFRRYANPSIEYAQRQVEEAKRRRRSGR